jgi:hypothetical protein
VDGCRPSRAAIARTGWPAATPTAISSRSATGKYRPLTRPGPFAFTPPACRNHTFAIFEPTPAASPASFTPSPARTPSQNTACTGLGTPGRPFFATTTS